MPPIYTSLPPFQFEFFPHCHPATAGHSAATLEGSSEGHALAPVGEAKVRPEVAVLQQPLRSFLVEKPIWQNNGQQGKCFYLDVHLCSWQSLTIPVAISMVKSIFPEQQQRGLVSYFLTRKFGERNLPGHELNRNSYDKVKAICTSKTGRKSNERINPMQHVSSCRPSRFTIAYYCYIVGLGT